MGLTARLLIGSSWGSIVAIRWNKVQGNHIIIWLGFNHVTKSLYNDHKNGSHVVKLNQVHSLKISPFCIIQ